MWVKWGANEYSLQSCLSQGKLHAHNLIDVHVLEAIHAALEEVARHPSAVGHVAAAGIDAAPCDSLARRGHHLPPRLRRE